MFWLFEGWGEGEGIDGWGGGVSSTIFFPGDQNTISVKNGKSPRDMIAPVFTEEKAGQSSKSHRLQALQPTSIMGPPVKRSFRLEPEKHTQSALLVWNVIWNVFTRPGFLFFRFFFLFFFPLLKQRRPRCNFLLARFSSDEFIIRKSIQSRKFILTKFFQILFHSLGNLNPESNPSTDFFAFFFFLL